MSIYYVISSIVNLKWFNKMYFGYEHLTLHVLNI